MDRKVCEEWKEKSKHNDENEMKRNGIANIRYGEMKWNAPANKTKGKQANKTAS